MLLLLLGLLLDKLAGAEKDELIDAENEGDGVFVTLFGAENDAEGVGDVGGYGCSKDFKFDGLDAATAAFELILALELIDSVILPFLSRKFLLSINMTL